MIRVESIRYARSGAAIDLSDTEAGAWAGAVRERADSARLDRPDPPHPKVVQELLGHSTIVLTLSSTVSPADPPGRGRGEQRPCARRQLTAVGGRVGVRKGGAARTRGRGGPKEAEIAGSEHEKGGAEAGTRTLTPSRAAEFKSAASACSATSARAVLRCRRASLAPLPQTPARTAPGFGRSDGQAQMREWWRRRPDSNR